MLRAFTFLGIHESIASELGCIRDTASHRFVQHPLCFSFFPFFSFHFEHVTVGMSYAYGTRYQAFGIYGGGTSEGGVSYTLGRASGLGRVLLHIHLFASVAPFSCLIFSLFICFLSFPIISFFLFLLSLVGSKCFHVSCFFFPPLMFRCLDVQMSRWMSRWMDPLTPLLCLIVAPVAAAVTASPWQLGRRKRPRGAAGGLLDGTRIMQGAIVFLFKTAMSSLGRLAQLPRRDFRGFAVSARLDKSRCVGEQGEARSADDRIAEIEKADIQHRHRIAVLTVAGCHGGSKHVS